MSDPLDYPEVTRFVNSVERYCALIEAHDPGAPADWLPRVHALLPELYASALALPWPEDAPDCPPASSHIREAPFPEIRCRNHYSEIFDPLKEPAKPGGYFVSGDLGEIYGELASGLECWRLGNHAGAVWHWHFGFERHWGRHLAKVLHVFHWLAFSYGFDVYDKDRTDA